VFCNAFTDGSFEWGHLVVGRDGFTPAVVVNSDAAIAMTPNLSAKFGLDAGAWPESVAYDVAGAQYEFVGLPTGRMTQFSESRWANYRAQYGRVQRVGENRRLIEGFSWLEAFADRITADGLDT
jgi:hypothetical protein